MSNESRPLVSRRRVFAGAGTAGALAAAAVALPRVRPVAATPAADAAAAPDDDGRYQATRHVLQYYQTARV